MAAAAGEAADAARALAFVSIGQPRAIFAHEIPLSQEHERARAQEGVQELVGYEFILPGHGYGEN